MTCWTALAHRMPPSPHRMGHRMDASRTRLRRRQAAMRRPSGPCRRLPASSSWDDLMYRIYVRQKIEAGLSDFRSGRVHTHASIRKELGLA